MDDDFNYTNVSRVHNLEEYPAEITCSGTILERVSTTKLLGITFNEHLIWGEHVTTLLSSCYGVLSVLRKLKNLATYFVRKQLVESLVLSKLNYCSTVFHPLPIYQLKRLQRVQNACAGFVLKIYASMDDLRTLNWLSVERMRELTLLKMTHKSLYNQAFPEYLKLELHVVNSYNLRSLTAPKLEIPKETGTFQDSAAKCFNVLPDNIRLETDYNKFAKMVKNYLFEMD